MRASDGRPTRWTAASWGRLAVPQQYDPSFWALLTGIPLLVVFVLALFARRKLREQAGQDAAPQPQPPAPDGPASAPRRRPVASPTPIGEHEFASAVRSIVLRTVAERAPAGWTSLVLCPPPHLTLMTWHIHLTPLVAVDLPDGRSVPVNPPAPTHEWQLSGGRRAGVGDGDPEPSPGIDAHAVRVTGPYLRVAVHRAPEQAPVLAAHVEGCPDGSPDLRAPLTGVNVAQAALREAIELAVGTRMFGSPPTLRYGLAAWTGHERIWITIGSG